MVVIPCFEYRVSLSVLAHQRLRQVVDGIRRMIPNLLYVNTFVVGSPIATCRDFLGVRRLGSRSRIGDVLAAAKPVILERARTARAGLVAMKELPDSLVDLGRRALAPEFFFVESLPTTYVPVQDDGTPPYPQRLRHKYRLLKENRSKAFRDAGLRWETVADFAHLADELHRLYLQVLGRAATRFETLTPQFFREVSEGLGERSFSLLCYRHGELVAFELFLQGRRTLHPLYLGLDYAHREPGALYFNCIYRIIDEAAQRGFSVVELGQSSYDVKAAMGAVTGRRYIGLHHRTPLVHRLMRTCRSALFPRIVVPRRRVFKDEAEARAIFARSGVEPGACDWQGADETWSVPEAGGVMR
jgi:hypothetical protein